MALPFGMGISRGVPELARQADVNQCFLGRPPNRSALFISAGDGRSCSGSLRRSGVIGVPIPGDVTADEEWTYSSKAGRLTDSHPLLKEGGDGGMMTVVRPVNRVVNKVGTKDVAHRSGTG